MHAQLLPLAVEMRAAAAYAEADRIADEDVEINRAIGRNGLKLIARLAAVKKAGEPVNVLTHCNAGWLATVDYGTATAPIYLAMEGGLNVHVYVDETRPRNQGASLTAWELKHHGAPHTLVVDNAGGHLMQHGLVDMVIVGTDRTTAQRRRLQQDRHLSQGACGARQRRAVLCRPALADDRLDGPRLAGKSRSRSEALTKSTSSRAWATTARSRGSGSPPKADAPSIRRSMSLPPAL